MEACSVRLQDLDSMITTQSCTQGKGKERPLRTTFDSFDTRIKKIHCS
jgi:hypothetical protein